MQHIKPWEPWSQYAHAALAVTPDSCVHETAPNLIRSRSHARPWQKNRGRKTGHRERVHAYT